MSGRGVPAVRIPRMSVFWPTAAPLRPGLRCLGLVIVIAGLFGMHGLASHGVQGMDMIAGSALSQSAVSSVVGFDSDAISDDVQAVATIERPDSLQASDSGHGDMDMSLAMMCVAILAVALLALSRSLRRERSAWILWARPRESPIIVRPWRGPAPPSLIALSIQRC